MARAQPEDLFGPQMSAIDADVLRGAAATFSEGKAEGGTEQRLRSRTEIQAGDRHSLGAGGAEALSPHY